MARRFQVPDLGKPTNGACKKCSHSPKSALFYKNRKASLIPHLDLNMGYYTI
jgi:hypothetical protein